MKTNTFETLRMDKDTTYGISVRKYLKRYGTTYDCRRTFQRHVHLGKVSVYISKRKGCECSGAKPMGGHDNIGKGLIAERLAALGVTSALIAFTMADSFN